ncbi:MAG: DNA repair protein RecN [Bacteroidales bacterium]|nr:DNA repair protein RecN [Bacteroidales bacterium]MCF8332815.1 DNA repair protein RecN [Bacteroidales bacterium]
MLLHLSIENYALIKQLDVDLNRGFTAITGETGAGKSILLGAMSLILGNRAETNILNDTSRKCIVEGHFDISSYQLKDFFERNELDYDEVLILRREISRNGKSRAFINDTPVKLPLMKEIGESLVDIHSQNRTLTLNKSDVQMAVIDNFAGHTDLLADYRKTYREYQNMQARLNELEERESQAKADQDYYQFLFDELEKADLKQGEQQEIENELELQNHAETIKSGLMEGYDSISASDMNIIQQLQNIHSKLEHSAAHHQQLSALLERLNSTIIELEDMAGDMNNLAEDITYNPSRAEELNERLNTLYELEHKHRVSSVEELIGKKQELEQKLAGISSLEDQIEKTRQEINATRQKLDEMAGKLSEYRKASIPKIEKEIQQTLTQLGMPDAGFQIKQEKLNAFSPEGLDKITFLFTANKGIPEQEIGKIASGGELSRLMLAVKSLIAKKTLLPTIIFDEIDSGVSGDIAGKVGDILKKMAAEMQVIAISHLPQIASKSNDHLFVYKDVGDNKTFSHIRRLSKEEQVQELAKMLSDERVTNAAIQTAKEMLEN